MGHDLIVVGGGPAGSTCARKAAQLGMDVLLIEKANHPRRKACGGGLTRRVTDSLDFDFSLVVEQEQCGLRLFSPSGLSVEEIRNEVTGYTVRREDFDHLLLRKAEEAGAEVIQGVSVLDVMEDSSDVRVFTDDKSHSANIVVGADGVNSTIARRSRIFPRWENDKIGLCIEASVPMDPSDIMRISRNPDGGDRVLIEIYFGALVHGYAWAFPKKNEFSLGIGVLVSEMHDLKGAWQRFVSSFENRYEVKVDLSDQTAMRVPLGGPIENTCSKRIMLIGDAAGFVAPATGEGIHYAIESGKIAAEVSSKIVSGAANVDTMVYQREWMESFGKDLKISKFLAGMMFHSIDNMERVCQMAHDDDVMRRYILDLIMGVHPNKAMRNKMIKRMLTKHPLKAIKMIV